MTTLTQYAAETPDKPAIIYGDGEFVQTYADLELSSRKVGSALQALGLEHGDCVAVVLANDDTFFDIFWACHRLGLYFTPINWHLQVDEIEYIVDNCDAKVVFAHSRFGEITNKATASNARLVARISVEGAIEGFTELSEVLASVSDDAELGEEFEGSVVPDE